MKVVKAEKRGRIEEPGTWYLLAPWDRAGSATVHKFVAGEEREVYTITAGECSCPGYQNRHGCKHLGFLVPSIVGDPVPLVVADGMARQALKERASWVASALDLGHWRRQDPVTRIHLGIRRKGQGEESGPQRIVRWIPQGPVLVMDLLQKGART